MRKIIYTAVALLMASVVIYAQEPQMHVPLGGNTFFDKQSKKIKLNENGISNWTDNAVHPVVYVRVNKTGSLKIDLKAKCSSGNSKVGISAGTSKASLNITDKDWKVYEGFAYNVTDTGYIAVKLELLNGTAPDISDLIISGSATEGKVDYVRDEFYWGRRGPSVHLNYLLPEDKQFEWFYNELTIPVGSDPLGSYFMSNGFGEGYCGIQVNSPTERRVLFSVWSPFKTDDPKSIPDSAKIKLLKQGEGVHIGEFGNEGSGGQSYLRYSWKAGNTYKFLTHVKPDGKGRTEYTSYFFAPEQNKWMLIASFSRPLTNTYYKHAHSFLENFDPEMGAHNRKVFCNNQWAMDTNGNWTELTKARFTADATAKKGARYDYAGGEENGSFYMTNCGFFKTYTPINSVFERKAMGKQPVIDFKTLP
ncbi:DUF3472 domain-containing protein [Danxiaibacter flavus]|uniref:DUF3472 domain-containing protein n=1 Tax=Danxiaibacter flavus TaxID=3049108 RepID=A0ABV3ZAP8_9BACT|nr:DUF3472 domain-containing protein [Chitinophagaceae bacterium DXS]